jgi:hypothetical protein
MQKMTATPHAIYKMVSEKFPESHYGENQQQNIPPN